LPQFLRWELYAIVQNVDGLKPGLYHYGVQEHALELLQAGEFGAAVMRVGLWQGFLTEASVCFIVCK
jgi:hypothetical protein